MGIYCGPVALNEQKSQKVALQLIVFSEENGWSIYLKSYSQKGILKERDTGQFIPELCLTYKGPQ